MDADRDGQARPELVPAPWRVVVITEMGGVARGIERAMAQRGHRVVGLLTSPRRSPRYIEVASDAGPDIDVIISSNPKRWAAMLAPLQPDLIVTAIFPLRVPAEVLALPRLGAVNFHPSLLPAYRGTDTPYWMLRNGERTWGMTLHRMTPEFDTGPVLAQTSFEISDDDTFPSIIPHMFGTMHTLLDTALPRIAAGDPGDPQDDSRATYFGKVTDVAAWRAIDWSQPAWDVHNTVRSCMAFWGTSGAVATLDGEPVTILRTQMIHDGNGQRSTTPGTVLDQDGDTLLVQCGDRPLRILELARA